MTTGEILERRYIKRDEAARFLGLSCQTLANMAWRGEGPPVVRLSSRCIRYDLSELVAWMKAHQEGPESLEAIDDRQTQDPSAPLGAN